MRRPSLQFYPADWQANPKLRRCSHAEKGIWLDVLCILHDQDEYGVVRWPLNDLSTAVHGRRSVLDKLVEKNILKGADVGDQCEPFVYVPRSGRKDGEPVTLIDKQDGPIWYSSRMVRDEYVRQHAGASTRFTKPSPRHSPSRRQGGGSSSSTATSSSKKKEPSAHAEMMDFLSLKIGPIPNGGKEGKAIKWLLEHGYDVVECERCFEYLSAQEWRTTTVTWTTVQTEIGGWKARRNGNQRFDPGRHTGEIKPPDHIPTDEEIDAHLRR